MSDILIALIGAAQPVLIVLALANRGWHYRAAEKHGRKEVARIRRLLRVQVDSLLLQSARDLEFTVARLFEMDNWNVVVTPATGDGGKDLVMRKGSVTQLVEVKKLSPENKVGRPMIMKLHSAITHVGADGGIFVTTSTYTPPASDFADAEGIVLIDGDTLALMLQSTFPDFQGAIRCEAMCSKCRDLVVFEGHLESFGGTSNKINVLAAEIRRFATGAGSKGIDGDFRGLNARDLMRAYKRAKGQAKDFRFSFERLHFARVTSAPIKICSNGHKVEKPFYEGR